MSKEEKEINVPAVTTSQDLSSLANTIGVPYSASDIDNMGGGQEFKRVQLFGSNSDKCKEGKIGMGHFGIVSGDNLEDIGSKFNCIPLALRPKAIHFGEEEIITLYDPNDPEFIRFRKEGDKGGLDNDYVWGVEFLLYIENHGCIPYYLCNKSGRYELDNFRSLMLKPAEVFSTLVHLRDFKFHAPKIKKTDAVFEVPSKEEIQAEITKFLKETTEAKSEAPEKAPEQRDR